MDTDHHSDGESVEKVDSVEKDDSIEKGGAQFGTWESDFSDVSSYDGYSTDSSWKPYPGNKLKREARLEDSVKAYGKTGDSDWLPKSYKYKSSYIKRGSEDIASKPTSKRGRRKKPEAERVQTKRVIPKSEASSAAEEEDDISGDDSNQKRIESQPLKKRGRPKKPEADRVQRESSPEDIGSKPPKKRGRPKKAVEEEDMSDKDSNQERDSSPEDIGSKPPKKRGRPKKAVAEEDMSDNESNQEVSGNRPSSAAADMSDEDSNQKPIESKSPKKGRAGGRGRPKKAVAEEDMSDNESNQEVSGNRPSSPAADMSDEDSNQKPIESKSPKKGRASRGRGKKAVAEDMSDNESNQEVSGSRPSSPAAAEDMSDEESNQKPIESKAPKKGRASRGRAKKSVSSAASD